MTTTSAATALAHPAHEFADAGTSPPCPGPVDGRNIAGETQSGAIAKLGAEADDTGVPGRASAEVTFRALPWARNVLAVIARPGQESADLGALLYAFGRSGARLALLCLTRGEASPLNSTCERLETVRPWELQVAAGLLGVSSVTVSDYPDGGLSLAPVSALTEKVRRAIRSHAPDLLLVVDPAAAGDPDDARAAKAACLAARGRPAGCGAHPAGRPQRLGDRAGRRHCGRPRHPTLRGGSARQPVRGRAAGTPPPGSAGRPGAAALAGAPGSGLQGGRRAGSSSCFPARLTAWIAVSEPPRGTRSRRFRRHPDIPARTIPRERRVGR